MVKSSIILGVGIDFAAIDGMVRHVDNIIDSVYEKIPEDIKERIDQRKSDAQSKAETISEEDERWIKEHIDEFFKKGGGGRERRG